MEKLTKAERLQVYRKVGEALNRFYRGEVRPRAVITEHTPNHYSVKRVSEPQAPLPRLERVE